MLTEIFGKDRRLRIEHKKLLSSPIVNNDIIKIIDHYLSDFADYNNLTPQNILRRYNNFASRYSDDIKNFISKGKYPLELGKINNIDRIDYDISLILSPVVTIHRHRIMDNLIKYSSFIDGKVLMIGLGSGIELELLNILHPNLKVEAYDISVTSFVKNRFSKNNIIKGKFRGGNAYYDHIISIELLEHLDKPYSFISMCYRSLKNEGTFITTSATNVPQFDHLYNFDDDNDFEKRINSIGFVVLQIEDILHDYMNKSINAKNRWYVFKKT